MVQIQNLHGFRFPVGVIAVVLCACAPRGRALVEGSIPVAELHRNTLSHDGALERLGSREEFAVVRSGEQEGRRRQVVTADGRIWRTWVIGNRWIQEGFDGRVAWRQERGGATQILREDRSDGLQLEAAMLGHRYLLDEAWTLESTGGVVEIDGLPHDEIVVRGSDGLRAEIALDRAETFARRTRWGRPWRRTQMDWSDFRTVASVPLPYRTQVAGPDGEVEFRTTHMQPYEGDDGLFQMPRTQAPLDHWLLDGFRVTGIPLEVGRDGWTVKVGQGEGVRRSFVLDFGRSATAVFAQEVSDGDVDASVDLLLAGMRWSPESVEREDRSNDSWGGVLGRDFFDAFVVVLDPRAGTMEVHDRAVFHYEGGGAWMPIHWVDGQPRIAAMVGREYPAQLAVELAGGGASGLALGFVEAKGIPVPGVGLHIYGRSVQAPLSILDDSPFDGRLGPDVWADFRLVIETARGGAWIEGPF